MTATARRKGAAAVRAVEFVASGMIVGLGSGSTAGFAIRRIGALFREGALRDLLGVPTSAATESEARRLEALGTRRPVEVLAFGWRSQARYLQSLGARVSVRSRPDGTPFATDQGNLILDRTFGPIPQPAELAARLGARAGILEHGLFLGLATDLIVAGDAGITHRTRP